MKPVVLITQGDFNGIGPEVALEAVTTRAVQKMCVPVLVGSIDVFEYYAKVLRKKVLLREIENTIPATEKDIFTKTPIYVINPKRFERVRIAPGKLSAEAGRYAGDILTVSVKICLQQLARAVVTAPVSKEAMQLGGYKYPGQTDMLAALCRTKKYAMVLIANNSRIGLATIHLPLKAVHRSINRQRILEKLEIIHQSLKRDFAITSPKIAVLGLNPHAGENGLLGSEEKKEILPALQNAKAAKIRVDGPFPADGFFGTHSHQSYDAVLAMYHDQGLIPLKMIGFEKGVNFTAGLPIVRTSPDHGTAFDIAGKGIANPTSMIEAIKLAVTISNNRSRGKT